MELGGEVISADSRAIYKGYGYRFSLSLVLMTLGRYPLGHRYSRAGRGILLSPILKSLPSAKIKILRLAVRCRYLLVVVGYILMLLCTIMSLVVM